MTPAFGFNAYPLELPHDIPHGFPRDALLSFIVLAWRAFSLSVSIFD
jgi:hypothetical protein